MTFNSDMICPQKTSYIIFISDVILTVHRRLTF